MKAVIDVGQWEEGNVDEGKELSFQDMMAMLKILNNVIRAKKADKVVLQSPVQKLTESVEKEIIRNEKKKT